MVTASDTGFREFQNRVLEYTLERGLLPPYKDLRYDVKTDFLLRMGMRHLIPQREPIHVDETISEHRTLFFNWYLLEREHRDGKTIAILYLESDEYDGKFGSASELMPEAEEWKDPEHGAFVISRKRDKGVLEVHHLGREEEMLVYDRSGYENLEEGQAIITVLYPFKGIYYNGADQVKIIPREVVDEHLNWLEEVHRSEDLVEEFLDEMEEKFTEATVSRYWRDLSTYMGYLTDQGTSQIGDVDYPTLEEFFSTWYPRRTLNRSRNKARELLATIKRFYDWLASERGHDKPSDHMERIYSEVREDLLRLLNLEEEMREKRARSWRLNLESPPKPGWEERRIEGRFQVTGINGNQLHLRDIHEDTNHKARVREGETYILEHLEKGDILSADLIETKQGNTLRTEDIYYLWPSQSTKYLDNYL